MQGNANFDERPFIAIWETTQACELGCVHCPGCAQPHRNSQELTTTEAKRLIGEPAAMEGPVFSADRSDDRRPIRRGILLRI